MAGGLATLGDLVFRINPDDINWNYQVNTAVEETVGGRVVQILGATLSDITIRGHYGQNRAIAGGDSWAIAENFVERVRRLMYDQAQDSTSLAKLAKPVTFTYPPYYWKFDVYVLSITDIDGGSITHKTGKFSYQYELKLFPVEDASADPVGPKSFSWVPDQIKEAAIEAYIGRISDGLGWKKTGFNDPLIQLDIAGKDIGGGNPTPTNSTAPTSASKTPPKTTTNPQPSTKPAPTTPTTPKK